VRASGGEGGEVTGRKVQEAGKEMAGKFKKGDEVTVFEKWSTNDGRSYRNGERREQIYTYRFCIVTSWGKRQGTLIDAKTHEPIRVQVYEKYADHIFRGHGREIGLRYIEQEVVEEIASHRRLADIWEKDQYTGGEERIKEWRQAANEIEAGNWRLISWEEANAEAEGKWRERYGN
jgi:hypothetical protein